VVVDGSDRFGVGEPRGAQEDGGTHSRPSVSVGLVSTMVRCW
jgi:hypothetical protein